MFQPVGPQRPSVYWRRRLVLLASVVLVLVLFIAVVRAVTSGSSPAAAAVQTSPSVAVGIPRQSAPHAGPPRTSPLSVAAPATTAAASVVASSSASTALAGPSASVVSSPAPPRPCAARQVRTTALPAAPHYAIGSKPVLGMQVTNVGAAPCVQNLADSQVLLQIYNGAARVWGSHDCSEQPGADPRILPVGTPVRIDVVWSGMSSQPGCTGTRQRVGAGTYTLFVSLSGRPGTAATFTMS